MESNYYQASQLQQQQKQQLQENEKNNYEQIQQQQQQQVLNPQQKQLIILGPSQSGKSTLINLLAKKEVAEVGDESGQSITKSVKVYPNISIENVIYTILDTQGLGDSDLSKTDEEIMEEIFQALLTLQNGKIDGFILVEPMNNNALQLSILFQFMNLFFPNHQESTLILLTKADLVHKSTGLKKLEAIQLRTNNEPYQILKWASKKRKNIGNDEFEIVNFNDEEASSQIKFLNEKLLQLKPYPSQDLLSFQMSLEQIAHKIYIEGQQIIEFEEIQQISKINTENIAKTMGSTVIMGSGLRIALIAMGNPLSWAILGLGLAGFGGYQLYQQIVKKNEIQVIKKQQVFYKYNMDEAMTKARADLIKVIRNQIKEKLQQQKKQ